MANELVLVRHEDDPLDDRVITFAAKAGFTPVVRYPFKGEVLGEPGSQVAGTVIYGGGQDVSSRKKLRPFLHEEAAWIRACMDKGLPVLGICQGAQQIARLLGAEIKVKHTHEFGYYLIRPAANALDFMPSPLFMPQAHSHTFDIPDGAQKLASSDLFPNQAFRYGTNVYGLQFHPDVTIEGFKLWQKSLQEKYGKRGAQTKEEQDRLMVDNDEARAEWFESFLIKLFGKGRG